MKTVQILLASILWLISVLIVSAQTPIVNPSTIGPWPTTEWAGVTFGESATNPATALAILGIGGNTSVQQNGAGTNLLLISPTMTNTITMQDGGNISYNSGANTTIWNLDSILDLNGVVEWPGGTLGTYSAPAILINNGNTITFSGDSSFDNIQWGIEGANGTISDNGGILTFNSQVGNPILMGDNVNMNGNSVTNASFIGNLTGTATKAITATNAASGGNILTNAVFASSGTIPTVANNVLSIPTNSFGGGGSSYPANSAANLSTNQTMQYADFSVTNISGFGAKGNGIWCSNVSMTAGLTNLYAANAPFLPYMTNWWVWVPTAGGNETVTVNTNFPQGNATANFTTKLWLIAQITNVVDASDVSLNVAATATLTGNTNIAVAATNDIAAFQSGINFVSKTPGNWALFIPQGIYGLPPILQNAGIWTNNNNAILTNADVVKQFPYKSIEIYGVGNNFGQASSGVSLSGTVIMAGGYGTQTNLTFVFDTRCLDGTADNNEGRVAVEAPFLTQANNFQGFKFGYQDASLNIHGINWMTPEDANEVVINAVGYVGGAVINGAFYGSLYANDQSALAGTNGWAVWYPGPLNENKVGSDNIWISSFYNSLLSCGNINGGLAIFQNCWNCIVGGQLQGWDNWKNLYFLDSKNWERGDAGGLQIVCPAISGQDNFPSAWTTWPNEVVQTNIGSFEGVETYLDAGGLNYTAVSANWAIPTWVQNGSTAGLSISFANGGPTYGTIVQQSPNANHRPFNGLLVSDTNSYPVGQGFAISTALYGGTGQEEWTLGVGLNGGLADPEILGYKNVGTIYIHNQLLSGGYYLGESPLIVKDGVTVTNGNITLTGPGQYNGNGGGLTNLTSALAANFATNGAPGGDIVTNLLAGTTNITISTTGNITISNGPISLVVAPAGFSTFTDVSNGGGFTLQQNGNFNIRDESGSVVYNSDNNGNAYINNNAEIGGNLKVDGQYNGNGAGLTNIPVAALVTNGLNALVGSVPTILSSGLVDWQPVISSGGNVKSNTTTWFNNLNVTNNLFVGSNGGNTNVNNGVLIIQDGINTNNNYVIAERAVLPLTTFPVATMSPLATNVPMSLDVAPGLFANTNYSGNGIAWIDVCNTNVNGGNTGQIDTLRLAEFANGNSVVSSAGFNGATPGDLFLQNNLSTVMDIGGTAIYPGNDNSDDIGYLTRRWRNCYFVYVVAGAIETTGTNSFTMTSGGFTNNSGEDIRIFNLEGTSLVWSNTLNKASFNIGTISVGGDSPVMHNGEAVIGTGVTGTIWQ